VVNYLLCRGSILISRLSQLDGEVPVETQASSQALHSDLQLATRLVLDDPKL
jgi:hypothetical protein